MFQNVGKANLISEISGHKTEITCQNILKLLDLLIQETRVDNDTATVDSVLINQGKIKGYSELKECIERGLPGSANFS